MAFCELALHLLEWTPKPGESILSDADASVRYGKRYALVACPSTNGDTTAGRRKFYGIGEQVEDNLL